MWERGPRRDGSYLKLTPETLYCYTTFIHMLYHFGCYTIFLLFSFSSSSRGISFEIPLDGDPSVPPCGGPSLCGMTRSASSEGLGFKVHYAPRGGMKHQLSLMPVNVNGQSSSRDIPEEDDDFTSHKPLGRNNTFSIKNQSRYSRRRCGSFWFLCNVAY